MKTSTLIPIAAIAALGIGAYFLLKDFKLPNLGDLFAAPLIIAGAAPETIKETGVVGGVGDIIYNISGGEGIRERATTPEGVSYKAAVVETEKLKTQVKQPDVTIPKEAIVARAVALDVATTMHDTHLFGEKHKDEGFPAHLVKAAIPIFGPALTIAPGLAAITQQRKYYESLPTPELKQAAVEKEYTQRQEWIKGHPLESMIGFPAGIIHAFTTPTKQTDFFSTMARGWGRIFG